MGVGERQRGWEAWRGCKKEKGKKEEEVKEVQKERTGLSLCFGWRGIQRGMRREGLREGEEELILLSSHAK